MAQPDGDPRRFRELERRARRDRDVSRVAVAILKAESRLGQTLERALAQADLTLPQFNVLMELAATKGARLPLHELNRRLISTPPNTSWLTTKMQAAGLVTKERDPRDARVVLLALTEQGWDALAEAAPLVFDAEREILAYCTRDDLRSLAALLAPLVEQPK
jgi:DNA-binding MarR family transcriptional regulator